MPLTPTEDALASVTVRGLPLYRGLETFRGFVRDYVSGSVLLLAATLIALIWANSPWAAAYTHLWETELAITLGGGGQTHSLRDWINDGLMALFFFVVGLEIKREILVGELSSRRGAALPIVAALGGMVVPASLFLLLNGGGEGAEGWAIPMATDIAFAVGILAALGDRVPLAGRVFLTALAIIDDIGAVLVIALVYTGGIEWRPLVIVAALLVTLLVANRAGIQHPAVYGVLGLGVWLAVFDSGIHATIAGVLVALTIPVRTRVHPGELVREGRRLLDALEATQPGSGPVLANPAQQQVIHELANYADGAEPPLQRLEHSLNPWVAYLIVPLFALANAGVPLPANIAGTVGNPIFLGVVAGLVIGKPVGIVLATWLAVRLGLADLPAGVNWRQVTGLGALGGIGFTMSLFITGLAFGAGELADAAKLGILAASIVAATLGWLILASGGRRTGSA